MELVILSGKGGTGKTTIASSLSELAKDVFKVDCDVDASNLYLFYEGENIEKGTFYGGKKAPRCIFAGSCCCFVLVRAQSCSFVGQGWTRGGIVVRKSRDNLVRMMGMRWELKASWYGRVHELQR